MLIFAFKDFTFIRSNGLKIGSIKYRVLGARGRSIYAKKVRSFYIFQMEDGIVCVKTKHAIILGLYGDPVWPNDAINEVEQLADKIEYYCK